MKKEKNDVYIITARRKREGEIVEKITNEWLKDNGILYDELFINIKEKSKIVNQLKIDIFIDDNFKNCKEASNLGVRTLLMDSRLNKNLNDEKIKRVFSWNDIERDLI